MNAWNEIISVIVSNGIFATLFVFLFFYQLKDSSKREKAYQETISKLSQNLEIVEEVNEKIDLIKDALPKKRSAKNEKQV